MQRLMEIPGIGPTIATALVAAVGTGSSFGKRCDLAAWFGMVPRQITTGGNFGLKVGIVGRGKFGGRVLELVAELPELEKVICVLLAARRQLSEGFAKLHREVVKIAMGDTVCMRLMTFPGVGAVSSLAFVSIIDIPARFRRSRAVRPVLGLTPVLNQSGERRQQLPLALCTWNKGAPAAGARADQALSRCGAA